jgi:hypothetical protein
MRGFRRVVAVTALVAACLSLSSCSGSVGVGLNVGVPIGDHGYVSVGGGRWF